MTVSILGRLEQVSPGSIQKTWRESFHKARIRMRAGAIIQRHIERTPEVTTEDLRRFFTEEKLPGEYWYEE
jgi:hypothetical protein